MVLVANDFYQFKEAIKKRGCHFQNQYYGKDVSCVEWAEDGGLYAE